MQKEKQIKVLFQPLIGIKAWGASIGWGSFVTIEFGQKHLSDHHYHGDWHLWLYQCDWELRSDGRLIAHSESQKHIMQLAIENLNGTELTDQSFDSQNGLTEFTFDNHLHLPCKPYPDAAPDEDWWMLFMPDQQVASLSGSGLKLEPAGRTRPGSVVRR